MAVTARTGIGYYSIEHLLRNETEKKSLFVVLTKARTRLGSLLRVLRVKFDMKPITAYLVFEKTFSVFNIVLVENNWIGSDLQICSQTLFCSRKKATKAVLF